eukprot:gene1544-1805_t
MCQARGISMSGGRTKAKLVERLLEQQNGLDVVQSYHRGAVEYALPILVIRKIIRYAYTLATTSYPLSDNSHQWRLSLVLVSKELFEYVSTELYTNFELFPSSQSKTKISKWIKDINLHKGKPLSPFKRVVKVTADHYIFSTKALFQTSLLDHITWLSIDCIIPVDMVLYMPMLTSLTMGSVSNSFGFDFTRLLERPIERLVIKDSLLHTDAQKFIQYLMKQTTLRVLGIHLVDQPVMNILRVTTDIVGPILASKPLINQLKTNITFPLPSNITSLTLTEHALPPDEPLPHIQYLHQKGSKVLEFNANTLNLYPSLQSIKLNLYANHNFQSTLQSALSSVKVDHIILKT